MTERFSQSQFIQYQLEEIFPEVFTGFRFLPLKGIYNDGLEKPDLYFDGINLIKKGLVNSFIDGSSRYLTLKAKYSKFSKSFGNLTETRIIHNSPISREKELVYGYFIIVVFGDLDKREPFGELRLDVYTLHPRITVENLTAVYFPLTDENNCNKILNTMTGSNLDGLNIQFKYPQPILQWPLNNIRDINIWENLGGIYQRLIDLGYRLKVTMEI